MVTKGPQLPTAWMDPGYPLSLPVPVSPSISTGQRVRPNFFYLPVKPGACAPLLPISARGNSRLSAVILKSEWRRCAKKSSSYLPGSAGLVEPDYESIGTGTAQARSASPLALSFESSFAYQYPESARLSFAKPRFSPHRIDPSYSRRAISALARS